MDGKEGRYPTPLNVAEMAVAMLDPGPTDRVMDGSCGTGAFLATAAARVFEKHLARAGTTPHAATPDQLGDAQVHIARWAPPITCSAATWTRRWSWQPASTYCSLAGHPGNVFYIDARTFPDGELADQARACDAVPDGSMDVVITNPWFSTKELIDDESILNRYDLGKVWTRTDEGHFVNSGAVNGAGVPPEVVFLERAWRWAKPGDGRIAILLPDGLLGNPGDEYVRWWIPPALRSSGQHRPAGGAVQGDPEGLSLDAGVAESSAATSAGATTSWCVPRIPTTESSWPLSNALASTRAASCCSNARPMGRS